MGSPPRLWWRMRLRGENKYHRGQQIYYEEAGSKNSAVISTINPIEVWVKRTSDNVKYQIYVSELMKGAVTLKRRSA
ncbi:hypothetical protein AVEN_88875-1 [Araneus ventricosus]|uniref:Uncharacterized protein n=1 Tax=Araneus ventricosus TaxID=182803 RepID=A0A4Y2MMS8_ARAVE|nr:hypothetical protein AVEN_141100-1 [Araneus ventricosus]GBN28461.1 hypothetical protein AVEN_88875-1 [Araneus ventricosus]